MIADSAGVKVSNSKPRQIRSWLPVTRMGEYMNANRRISSMILPAALYLCITNMTAHAIVDCPGDGTNSAVVAEYVFGEGSGSEVFNSGLDGEDGDATLIYGADYHTDVPPSNDECGWSIQLPSSGSGSTTPAIETSTAYDPLAGASSFTIMAWVKRESGAANQNTSARIVSDTSSTSLSTNTAGVEFRFTGTAGTLSLRVNGNEVGTSIGGIAPNSNAWHHVAVVFDGTRPATNTLTRNVHFYVDGVQKGDGNTLQGVLVADNTNRLTLGNSAVSRGVGNLLVGKMDNLIILRNFAPDAVGNGQTNEAILCYRNRPDDLESPIISGPSDVSVSADPGTCVATNVNLGEPVVSDNCGVSFVTNTAPAQFSIGSTYVVWTAVDYAGNTASSTQVVIVVEYESPLVICPPDMEIDAGPCLTPVPVAEVDLGEPQIFDNCGVSSSIGITPAEFVIGTNAVIWRAWDASGNTNECTQLVVVVPSRVADCDGDGMSDWWEVYYGLDPFDDGSVNPDNGPNGDLSGDGITNLEVYLAGGNPHIFYSVPKIRITYPEK